MVSELNNACASSVTVVLASHNQHKMLEIAAILNTEYWQLKLASALGFNEFPPEDADTFEGNALIKARAVYQALGLPTLADDSGIVVDALGGAPGIHSARYGGAGATDAQNNQKLFADLAGIEPTKRTARFVCVIAHIDASGTEHLARGVCEGHIAHELKGVGGFGYDPMFLPAAYGGKRTMAELSEQEKNAISHRGLALSALKRELAL